MSNTLNDSSKFLIDIKNIQEKLPAILDDFKKYYIFYNKNPTYTEYQTMFENLKGNLNSINSELFKITNSVEKNTQEFSNKFSELNKLITNEKNKNIKLKSVYDKINDNFHGSKIMIDEYKQIYNEKYVNNIFIFIGIIVNVIILAKVFSGKGNVNANLPVSK